MVDSLSLALRGLALGFVVALVLGSAGLPRRARRALWPMLVCLAAYLARSAPQAAAWPPGVQAPLAIAALLFPVAFWWLLHNAFDDRADLPLPVRPAALLLLAAGLWPTTIGAPWLQQAADAAQKLVGAGFVVAALVRLWRGRAGDLVAGRRGARHALLAYTGAHGLAVLAVELVLRRQAPPAWLDTLNVAVIALALAVALALLLGFRDAAVQMLFGDEPAAAAIDDPASADAPEPAPAAPADAGDASAIDRLQRLMAVDHAYRDPELGLAALAQRCGLPEYRLRELIHRRLGFRNLAAFVNGYRLREVEQRLADPACSRLPILTLALEAGFGSIGPFNRAFRERHGMTPSAYRSGGAATSPPPASAPSRSPCP